MLDPTFMFASRGGSETIHLEINMQTIVFDNYSTYNESPSWLQLGAR